MKRLAIAAALSLASAAPTVALAASDRSADESLAARTDQHAAQSSGEHAGDAQGARFAEGSFKRFRGGDDDHGRGDSDDDDDDDDDGSASASRGGANRAADPNSATAPVPDSGVFNGKARPKVEVQ